MVQSVKTRSDPPIWPVPRTQPGCLSSFQNSWICAVRRTMWVCEPAACSQALPSCLCLAGLQYVDGLGKLTVRSRRQWTCTDIEPSTR